MRRNLILIVLIACLVGSIWYIVIGAKQAARDRLTEQLALQGFKNISISEVSVGPRQTVFSDIRLDTAHPDAIKIISLPFGWFGDNEDKEIVIESLDLYRTVDHINDLLPGLVMFDPEQLKNIPDTHILFKNARFNISTPRGAFQFTANGAILPYEGNVREIEIGIKSAQETLALTSTWSGSLDHEGKILLDGLIPEIKANIAPLRFSRGNGWLSLTNNNKYPKISGQIEAGAANLGSMPLQNFSLTLEAEQGSFTLLTRAQASGALDTVMAADILIGTLDKTVSFTITSQNLPLFINHLEQSFTRSVAPLKKAFNNRKTLSLAINYELDKRFPGGPYPFDLRGTTGGESFLSGTFLIYPGTFETRGSARISVIFLEGIRDYFNIPDSAISGEYMRLDGSLANFLSPLASGISTGIERDPGE